MKKSDARGLGRSKRVGSTGLRERPARGGTGQTQSKEALGERVALLQGLLDEAIGQLEDSRTQYVALHEFAPCPLLTLDARGFVLEANRAAEALLSLGQSGLVGKPLTVLVDPESRRELRSHINRCRRMACDASVESEVEIVTGAGEVRSVSLISRRANTVAEPSWWTSVVDRSERRALKSERDALAAAIEDTGRASEAKDLFIAVLGHELRAPLSAMMIAAGRLQRSVADENVVRQLASTIERSAKMQSRLIEDLFDVTRITRGRLRIDRLAVDMHEIAEASIEALGAEFQAKSLTVTTDLRANEHIILGDPDRMQQVLGNLLRNAIKFTPQGGRIGVATWNKPTRDHSQLLVEVSDSGVGIPEETLPKVFNAFEQASPGAGGGVGLGLAIVRGLVRAHDGDIHVSSLGVGKGTRFVVSLDVADATAAAEGPSKREVKVTGSARDQGVALADAPPAAAPNSILLVDDNKDLSAALALTLSAAGYRVETSAGFKDALARDLDRTDLVICDMQLGDGFGLDLVRSMRANGHSVTAIALSGYSSDADQEASKRAGFVAHLSKPVDVERLLTTVRRAISRDRGVAKNTV